MQAPLLESHFEAAAQVGIPRELLHQRYYQYHWSLERATTEPPTPRNTPSGVSDLVDLAIENGISRATYYLRVSKGMSPEEAATKPTSKRGRPRKRAYTDEQLEIANSRGISRQMLDRRLARGWDLERAITEARSEEWIRNHGEKTQMFVSRKQRPSKSNYTKEDLEIAKSNGINKRMLQNRLNSDWTMERATTQIPKRRTSKHMVSEFDEILKEYSVLIH